MADKVQERLETFVPVLIDFLSKKLFSKREIREIVRRRRDFEYRTISSSCTKNDYLQYIQYEIALETLRKHRCATGGWKEKSVLMNSNVPYISSLFARICHKWPQDKHLWYQYVDFCFRAGSTKRVLAVLVEALAFHPQDVSLWLLAADRELQLGHLETPRRLMQLALRQLPSNVLLWIEYLKFETNCVLRLAAAHLSILGEANQEAKTQGDLSDLRQLENLESTVSEDSNEGLEGVHKFMEGLQESSGTVKGEHHLIGSQHLALIFEEATQQLKGETAADLGMFLSSSLEIFSTLLASPNAAKIADVAELGKIITQKIVESRSDAPLIVFLMWKLQLLALSSRSGKNGDELLIKDSLSLLVSEIKTLWIQQEASVEASSNETEAVDNSNKRKRRSVEMLKQSLIPQNVASRKIKLFLLISLILILCNLLRRPNGPEENQDIQNEADDNCLEVSTRAPDINHSQFNDDCEDVVVLEFISRIFSRHPEYLEYLKTHHSLGLHSLILPTEVSMIQGFSKPSKRTVAALCRERQLIWKMLMVAKPNHDEIGDELGFRLSTDGVEDGTSSLHINDVRKREEICNWVTTVLVEECLGDESGKNQLLIPELIPIILAFIRLWMSNCHPEQLNLIRKIREKIMTGAEKVKDTKDIPKLLEYHVLLDSLREQIDGTLSEQDTLGIGKDTRSLLKAVRDKNHTVKETVLLDIVQNCHSALQRRISNLLALSPNKHTLITASLPEPSVITWGETSQCFSSTSKNKKQKLEESSFFKGYEQPLAIYQSSLASSHGSSRSGMEKEYEGTCFPFSVVHKLHEELFPIFDLLYSACPKEKLLHFIQEVSHYLIPEVYGTAASSSNICENRISGSLQLLEWNRIMDKQFGYTLLPIQRELIRRCQSIIVVDRLIQRLIGLLESPREPHSKDHIGYCIQQVILVLDRFINQAIIFDTSSVTSKSASLLTLIPQSMISENLILIFTCVSKALNVVQDYIIQYEADKTRRITSDLIRNSEFLTPAISTYIRSNPKLSRLVSLQLFSKSQNMTSDPSVTTARTSLQEVLGTVRGALSFSPLSETTKTTTM